MRKYGNILNIRITKKKNKNSHNDQNIHKKMLRSSIPTINSKKTQNKTLINCAQLELNILYCIHY